MCSTLCSLPAQNTARVSVPLSLRTHDPPTGENLAGTGARLCRHDGRSSQHALTHRADTKPRTSAELRRNGAGIIREHVVIIIIVVKKPSVTDLLVSGSPSPVSW